MFFHPLGLVLSQGSCSWATYVCGHEGKTLAIAAASELGKACYPGNNKGMGQEFDEGGDKGVGKAPAAGVVAFEGYGAGRQAFATYYDQDLVNQGIVPDGNDLLQRLQAAKEGDQVLLAQATDRQQPTARPDETLTGTEIADKAKELGETQPERWRNDVKRHIYTCNHFIDASLRESGVNLPWDASHIPTVHSMREQLAPHPDFDQVFSSASNKFENYKPQAGDVVVWDFVPHHYPTEVPRRFQHSGIVDDKGTLMYAGSTQTGGYAETALKTLVSVYGPPTVIYRYNPQHR